MNDVSIWSKIAEYGAQIVGALLVVVWGDAKRRFTKLETAIEEKADKEELDRQRDNIAHLFKENADMRKDMNGGFQRITDLIHSGQIQIMSELAKKADR